MYCRENTFVEWDLSILKITPKNGNMRVPLWLFSQFSLLVLVSLYWLYQKVETHYLNNGSALAQLNVLSEKIEQKNFENAITRAELNNLKLETLALLDSEKSIPKNLTLKEHLRDGLRSPASVVPLDMSPLRIEEIRTLFKEKKYNQVISVGEMALVKYSNSLLKPEIIFLLSEAYFLTNQFDKSIIKIEHLISLYPENIVTGYAMLRLASISIKADQINEAQSIYKIILTQFNDPALRQEASKMLSRVSE